MFDKKNFVLNCDICDARKIKEEDWQSYERILVNADIILVDDRSKSVLNALPIMTNVDETLEVSGEINLVTQNGNYEISGSTSFLPNTILCVNGMLTIAPGTEESLKNLLKIHVNGDVKYPQSLSSHLGALKVNGSTHCYPDDCIQLNDTFIIDRYFPLRAKENGRYYAENAVILTDTSINVRSLVEKNIHFLTNELIIAEELLEASISMFDENVEITVIPAGFAFVDGDCELDEKLIRKNGSRIYVNGSLTLNEESSQLFPRIDALHIKDSVNLFEEQVEAFSKLSAEYGQLSIISKARIIENKPFATLDNAILNASPDGVILRNCASIKIKEDISADLLLKKVHIENCAAVQCSSDQRGIVELICQNVATINDGESSGMNPADMLKNLLHSRVVNADQYVL